MWNRMLLLAWLLASMDVVANQRVVIREADSDGRTRLVSVVYDTWPEAAPRTTGIGIRIHYDSSVAAVLDTRDVLQRDLIAIQEDAPDTEDLDADPRTDRFLLVAWADINGGWPGALPQELLRLGIELNDGELPLNVTAVDTAAGTGFESTGLVLRP